MIFPNKPAYGERNDCTIRALASATGIGYASVAQYLRLCGKRRNCRFRFRLWLSEHESAAFGFKFSLVEHIALTGRYILQVPGHVWAVVDGKSTTQASPAGKFAESGS